MAEKMNTLKDLAVGLRSVAEMPEPHSGNLGIGLCVP
jgi:hypothetical protein